MGFTGMAKLLAADTANKVAADAVQIFGGNGFVPGPCLVAWCTLVCALLHVV